MLVAWLPAGYLPVPEVYAEPGTFQHSPGTLEAWQAQPCGHCNPRLGEEHSPLQVSALPLVPFFLSIVLGFLFFCDPLQGNLQPCLSIFLLHIFYSLHFSDLFHVLFCSCIWFSLYTLTPYFCLPVIVSRCEEDLT